MNAVEEEAQAPAKEEADAAQAPTEDTQETDAQ